MNTSSTVKTKMQFEARIYGALGGTKGTYINIMWHKPGCQLSQTTLCFPAEKTSQRLDIEGNLFMVHFNRAAKDIVIEFFPEGFLEKSIRCEVETKSVIKNNSENRNISAGIA